MARRSFWWMRPRLRRLFVGDDQTPCALVLMGVSGSGKSTVGETLAARLGWPYEDADQFHPASNVAKMSAGHPLTDEDRWPWLKAIAAEIDRVCDAGGRVVIGCSALKRAYRDVLSHHRTDIRLVYLKARRPSLQSGSAAAKVISCHPDSWPASSTRSSRPPPTSIR